MLLALRYMNNVTRRAVVITRRLYGCANRSKISIAIRLIHANNMAHRVYFLPALFASLIGYRRVNTLVGRLDGCTVGKRYFIYTAERVVLGCGPKTRV